VDQYENSWLFDLVHGERDNDARVAFYRRSIERFGEPVLELGSGAGNQLVARSRSLLDFEGLDEFEGGPATDEADGVSTDLLPGDMRTFQIEQKFRLIFAAGNSMQHLLTPHDVASCFHSVRKHLFPFGRFIAEVFNPSLPKLCRPEGERHFVGEYRTADGWIVVTETVRYDAATQVDHVDWHYRNQYAKDEQTVSFKMRQFFPQEFDAVFAANGFRIEEKFGDFNEAPFTSLSPKQIVIASPA
jgi:hypothetical protein